MVLDTFQLQDIQTEGNYLADLGRPEAARAEKEAAIAEAVARREAEQARIRAEEDIAVANRELALKQAEIKAETDAASANAAASGPLAQAAKDQDVLAAQEHVAARRAELKERELDTEVRKPADAQRYAVEQAAAAEKAREIAEAEAQAETTRLSGAPSASAAPRVRGHPGRGPGRGRGHRWPGGRPRPTRCSARPTPTASYGDAAVVDIVAATLPKVVAEAAAPMAKIDQMTVISTDGASQTVRSVASTVAQGSEMLKALFGVDLAELVQGFGAKGSNGNGAEAAADPPPPPALDPAAS